MIKDSTNNTILNVIEDIRALKEDVKGITRKDLEHMEERLLESLKEEHNGRAIVKFNGR